MRALVIGALWTMGETRMGARGAWAAGASVTGAFATGTKQARQTGASSSGAWQECKRNLKTSNRDNRGSMGDGWQNGNIDNGNNGRW